MASPLRPQATRSGFSPPRNETPMIVFGSPTDNVRERDDNYKVLKDLKKELDGAWNYGLEIVEQKKDGQILIKKKVMPHHYKWQLTATSLSISRPLYHQNICRVVDSYFASDMWRVYTELCDLGDLQYFLQRDKKGETKGRLPGTFYWHVVKSLAEAFCYLAYGYDTIDEVLANDGEKAGWDSVIHGDVSASNFFVKSAGLGEYPIIKVGDFDGCSSRTQFGPMYDPQGDPAVEVRKFQHSDLRTLHRVLRDDVLPDQRVDPRPEIQSIYRMMRSWCVGGDLAVDARGMAKSLKETMENEKVRFDVPFPAEFVVPHKLFQDTLAFTGNVGSHVNPESHEGPSIWTKAGRETNSERQHDDEDEDSEEEEDDVEIPSEDEHEDDEEENKSNKTKGRRKRTRDEDKDWEEEGPYNAGQFAKTPDITGTSSKRQPKHGNKTQRAKP